MESPRFSQLQREIPARFPAAAGCGPLLLGEGNPMAHVTVIGYEPDKDEAKVFTGVYTSGIRQMLFESLGAPAHRLYMTYVLKRRQAKRLLTWPVVKPWSNTVWDEIGLLKSPSTILLGIETAWAVLGTDEPDIEKLRRKVYMHPRAVHTNFFVTYSNEDVLRFGGLTCSTGAAWAQDLTAVFEVDRKYFQPVRC